MEIYYGFFSIIYQIKNKIKILTNHQKYLILYEYKCLFGIRKNQKKKN